MTARIYSFSKRWEHLRDVRALQPDTTTDRSVAFLMTSPAERSSRRWTNDDKETDTGKQEPSVISGKQANSLCPLLDCPPISCHSFLKVCPLSPPSHTCVPVSQVLFGPNRSPWSSSVFCLFFCFCFCLNAMLCCIRFWVFQSNLRRQAVEAVLDTGAVFAVSLPVSSCNSEISALLLHHSDCPQCPDSE